MRLKTTTQFERVLEAVPDALVGMDQRGTIRFVNRQTELLFGHDREQLVGQHISVLVPEVLWEFYDQHREGFFADPASRSVEVDLELRGRHHNGGEFPISVTLSYIDTGDVLLAITAVGDVVRQKRAVAKAELLDTVVTYSHEAVTSVNVNGIITSWNPAAEGLYGYSSREAIGAASRLLMAEDRESDERALLAKIKDGQAVVHVETMRVRKDGTVFPVLLSVAPVRGEDGAVVGATVIHRDATGQREAFEATQRLSAVVESSDDAVIGRTLDGIITSWNPAAERLFGYSSEEVIGADASLLMPEDRAGDERALLAKIKDGVAVEHLETTRVRKDGTVLPVLLSVAPVRDPAGAVIGETTVLHDVTEQRKAFEAAQRLSAIVEGSYDAVFSKTLDGIITGWNAAAARMYGYPSQDVVGKSVELLAPKDRPEEFKDILARVRAGQRVEHLETMHVRNDGVAFPVSLTVSPIRDPGGSVVGASAIARDLTELREALTRAQDLIEAAPDSLVGVDQAGVIQFVNRQAELSFGYDRDELVGRPVEMLVPQSSRAVHVGHRASYVEDPVTRPMGAGRQLTGLRRDGTQFPVDMKLSSVQTMDGLLVTAAVRDVTEQRKASETAQRLAAIVDSTDDAVIGTTLEGIVTDWNAAAERMLGYSREEIIGKSGSLLNDTDRAEGRPAARARITAGQQVDRFETMLNRKDGTKIPVSCTLSGVRDAGGSVVGASVIARDLTEQRRAEKALAEASRQYRLLAENASDLVVMTSPDRVVTWVSPSVTGVLGWVVEDLMGKTLVDLVHPEDMAAFAGVREAVYSGQEVSTPSGGFQLRWLTKSGQYRWMAGVPKIVRDESGAFAGIVSNLRDVDELVRAREAAEADRATLRATLDALMDPHVLLEAVRDDRGQIVDFLFVDANPAACAYMGIACQDLVGSRMLERYPGVGGAGLMQKYVQVVETGEPFRLDDLVYPVQPLGGQERHLDIRAVRVGDGLTYTWRDVTDR